MKSLKEYFQEQLIEDKHKEYNIFSTLHSPTDETRLHSRFIAFLLDPYASHGFEDAFFKLFLQHVLHVSFDSANYTVLQDYQYIDIFIYNDTDAIIIENKIDARYNAAYTGQLERYYHTISTGINSNDEEIELKRNVVQIAYLTLNGHSPSTDSLGNLPIRYTPISYIVHITNWLNACLDIAQDTNPILAHDIGQYLALVTKLTNDMDRSF